MKTTLVAVAALAALAGCVGLSSECGNHGPPLRVAVFVGSGARNVGAFRWAEILSRARDVVAIPVDGEAVRGGALDDADVLVMPGGSSVGESKSLGREGRKKVVEFVERGGGYLGTCAGFCLLMEPEKRKHPDMLHMIPFKFSTSAGKADVTISFNRRAAELAGIKKGDVRVHYSRGPVPLPSLPVEKAEVEVIATYNGDLNSDGDEERPSMAGQAAAIAGTYGKGRLFALAVHPEHDEDDHYILKGAFRYLTGREVDWDYPQRRRGQLAVGFMCDDSFGVGTAKLLQRLLKEGEFDLIPLNKGYIADGGLHNVDAVLAPDGEGSSKPEEGLYGGNADRTKAFLARGGRIFAWGRAAEAAKTREKGVVCVAGGEAAVAALRAFAAEPCPAAKDPVPVAKVDNPIRAGILQNPSNSCNAIARMLYLSPEYDLKVLAPEEYSTGGLDGLDLVIQPGGGCTSQYRALGEDGAEAIKRFVRGGGKYYGVCAGAFLALQQTREARPRLGLVPFKGDDPEHYRGSAPIKVTFTEDGRKAFGTTNTCRTVVYSGGPAMVPGDPVEDVDVKILANYSGRVINTRHGAPVKEMYGKGAFAGGRVGKGRLFISCPHPEKQEQTMEIVRGGMKFLTGVEPTPVYVDRSRGAVSVRYFASDSASLRFLLAKMLCDRRFYVWPATQGLSESRHIEAMVVTGVVSDGNAKTYNRHVERGGKVVALCDTPEKAKAAAKLRGAVVVDSYDSLLDAILR